MQIVTAFIGAIAVVVVIYLAFVLLKGDERP